MVSLDQTAPPLSPAARKRAAILLVDDQRFVGLALGRLLDDESGFALHCCDKGLDAVAQAERLQPAVILQDLVMPDVDGLALVQRYREHPATARIPVVVLSGNDDAATRARALAAGAAAYLVKLPTRDLLIEALRQQLHASAMAAPSAQPARPPASTAVLDPETLASYRDEDAADPNETLRALIEVFLSDTDEQMAALRAALAGDAPAVKPIAHALKGCSLAIGARRLALMYARLEADGGVSDALTLGQIENELGHVRTACSEVR